MSINRKISEKCETFVKLKNEHETQNPEKKVLAFVVISSVQQKADFERNILIMTILSTRKVKCGRRKLTMPSRCCHSLLSFRASPGRKKKFE